MVSRCLWILISLIFVISNLSQVCLAQDVIASTTPSIAVTKQAIDAKLLVFERKIGGHTYAVGRILIKAKPEKVWEVLTNYGNATAIFNNLRKCEVLDDSGNTKRIRQWIKTPSSALKFDYVVEVKEDAPHSLKWHRTSGSFKEVLGAWRLEPDASQNYTTAEYQLYVDGGLFLPAWLIRPHLKNYLPEILRSVKRASERELAYQLIEID